MTLIFNFNTAYTLMRELYGVELTPDQFETMGLIAWEKIGNKSSVIKQQKVEIKDGIVELPCNVDALEAVTTDLVDFQKSSVSKDHYLLLQEVYAEQYIERTKGDRSPLYTSGEFVKYVKVDYNKIQVHRKSGYVNILYKTINQDEDGLPYLNAKEVDAIAAYCAFADTFKKGLMTRNGDLIQLAQALETNWKQLCDHARTPISISLNDMDMIGDVVRSWDRKAYGNSYKPIR